MKNDEIVVDSRTGAIMVYIGPKVNCFEEIIGTDRELLFIPRPRDERGDWEDRDCDEEIASKFAQVYRELSSIRSAISPKINEINAIANGLINFETFQQLATIARQAVTTNQHHTEIKSEESDDG